VSVVQEKKVRRRKLCLAQSPENGWILQFADSAFPLAYYFDDERGARETFDRVGTKSSKKGGGAENVVVTLESQRFASSNARRVASIAERVAEEAAKGNKWKTMPKGWTDESRKKFWNSLVGDSVHQVTKCMKEMEGKVDDPGAFCGSLADRVVPGWRKKVKRKK